ncbi:MAG: helix-turn-helix transcriptional regulator [Methanomassiliicoccales archaeon]|nr:helix-turn-helix transcriptional regulator [Methanomassiliicoccales archaeon]NYT15795.1 helix-turn-helix transcriptional regulator [Methanomassiliicoccales archaeon]
MFELSVISNTPLTPLTNIDDVALQFLRQIGYLPKGYDPKTEARTVQESVPYRLFMDCFMRNIKRVWLVDEMAIYLETTRPTIYRHLNKLKGMDVIEESETERDGQMKKGYRIRYGDLRKAWSFTEANVEMAMESYRKTIDHFQELAEKEARE